MKLIAYIRTSTSKQCLGLEAQQALILRAAEIGQHEILATYIEQESGKNNEREEFDKAINDCLSLGASLCVAKIDRLSRNAAFALTIRERLAAHQLSVFEAESGRTCEGIEFGFKVVFADDEGKKISQRTKQALAAKKEQYKAYNEANGLKKGDEGYKSLGAPNSGFSREQIDNSRKNRLATAVANNAQALKFIFKYCQGLTFAQTARDLNEIGIKTVSGKTWSAIQVSRLLDMYSRLELGGKAVW